MLTPFPIFTTGFGSLVVNKPLIRHSNGRKTKTHESDQTVITTTQAGQRHQVYCPKFGNQQEYGESLPCKSCLVAIGYPGPPGIGRPYHGSQVSCRQPGLQG